MCDIWRHLVVKSCPLYLRSEKLLSTRLHLQTFPVQLCIGILTMEVHIYRT